ncbi:hypothetical protein TNCV_3547041 [Trichonephila clavipes]|nr:hypothetical protein TNCV_3547041 [Trichonephila clavipes]
MDAGSSSSFNRGSKFPNYGRQRHFGVCSKLKNIIDVDSDDENEINDAAPVPTSSDRNAEHHEKYQFGICQRELISNEEVLNTGTTLRSVVIQFKVAVLDKDLKSTRVKKMCTEREKDFNDDPREENTDFFQSIPGIQEYDENVETPRWQAMQKTVDFKR